MVLMNSLCVSLCKQSISTTVLNLVGIVLHFINVFLDVFAGLMNYCKMQVTL